MKDLLELRDALRLFARERDWEMFHSPKNLSMAVAAEAGELLEPFLWLTEEQSRNLSPAERRAVAEELADVMIYLVRLADVLDLDLLQAAGRKLESNAAKYPVDKARGNARKYTAFTIDEDTE